MNKPFEYDVYVVSDSIGVLSKAIDDGAWIVQLRDKSGDLQSIKQKALELLKRKNEKEFIFILNDDPELALEVGADGVHVGQDEWPMAECRALVGHDFIIGRSTHSIDQGLKAQDEGANYISVGPVFATPTKPGRPAVGLDYIREAAARIRIPFVTIGGIDRSNIDDVLTAGAKTIGIVRAANQTAEILRTIRTYYNDYR
ncbi:MAG: thiamine phosphate synthase [Candidatus Omnitrophota bacterium]